MWAGGVGMTRGSWWVRANTSGWRRAGVLVEPGWGHTHVIPGAALPRSCFLCSHRHSSQHRSRSITRPYRSVTY